MNKIDQKVETGIKAIYYPDKTPEEIKELAKEFNRNNNPAFKEEEPKENEK